MTKLETNKRKKRNFALLLLTIATFIIGYSVITNYTSKKRMGFYNYFLAYMYPNLSTKGLCNNCELKIPKIIHRVWLVFDPLKPDMPELYKKFDKRLKELHPDWKIKEWNDKMVIALIKEHYPDFLSTYYSYPNATQRMDVARFLILHHYGGMTIQHSYYLNKNLEPLLKGADFVASPQVFPANLLNPCFFASTPKHPILERIIKYLPIREKELKSDKDNFVYYVFSTTSSILFSDVIYNYLKEKPDPNVRILESKYLMPFSYKKKFYEPIWSSCISYQEDCKNLFPESYGHMLWTGSWIKE